MKLHDLGPNAGSNRKKTRVGRGISAGKGKTAGRGTKGYGARRGGGGKIYRQGGNLPFYRSLPFKRGFINTFRTEYAEVNVARLDGFDAGTEVTPQLLVERGIVRHAEMPVALLGQGDLKKALTIKVHRASKNAVAKVEAAGGKVELIA
jgi:large subunit ribosomal protein L15